MSDKIKLELLAPAKNAEYGKEAVRCGADALYIGAPAFGARYSAGNSIEDIAGLVRYAHLFGVRVYAAMNTVLFDDELDEARDMAQQLVEAGVDALIVQDMAYAAFGLDVSLHASTQAAAFTPESALFLQNAGFDRVILERGMTLDEIRAVRKASTIDLEAFVHGAICVSYSGRCYMGLALSGRSGNRGVCSQPCRSRYDLVDGDGNVLIRDKHLLSLRDLDLSSSLHELAEAGVTSFKIEGRLKDLTYLKNTVLHYRKKLDELIGSDSRYTRASAGHTVSSLTPDINKSFTRGFTSYYLYGRKRGVSSFDTGKSIGEPLGEVASVRGNTFTLHNGVSGLNNGDGICFVGEDGVFTGTNVNRILPGGIEPNRMEGIASGVLLYRNYDKKFSDSVIAAKVERKIGVSIRVTFGDKISVAVCDETGIKAGAEFDNTYEKAKSPEIAEASIKKQFSKSGGTVFDVNEVEIGREGEGDIPFIPASALNEMRRTLLENLETARTDAYERLAACCIKTSEYPAKELSYKGNVTNKAAEDFYRACGVESIAEGPDKTGDYRGVELMRTKYCIRRETGRCLKKVKDGKELYLVNNGVRMKLGFDCDNCEMVIYKE